MADASSSSSWQAETAEYHYLTVPVKTHVRDGFLL